MKIVVNHDIRFPFIPLDDLEQAVKDFELVYMPDALEHFKKENEGKELPLSAYGALINPSDMGVSLVVMEGLELLDVTEEDIFPEHPKVVFAGHISLSQAFEHQLNDSTKTALKHSNFDTAKTYLTVLEDGSYNLYTTGDQDGDSASTKGIESALLAAWRDKWMQNVEKVVAKQKAQIDAESQQS